MAAWIAETEAEKASYALVTSRPKPRPRMTEREIKSIVDKLANIARVLIDADPGDKAEIFRKLGLKLTYHPGAVAGGRSDRGATPLVFRQCPRSDSQLTYMIDIALTTEFSLAIGAR